MLGCESQLLPSEDEDVSEAIQRLFEDEGIDLILNARAKRISGKSGESVRILLEKNGNGTAKTLEGSHLLLAIGRTPNTQGIGLELAGVDSPTAGT